MLKNLTSPSRLRSNSVFSVSSALTYLSETSLTCSLPTTPTDATNSNRQSNRCSYQSYQTFQTDSITLIDSASFQFHNINYNIQNSIKASKVLGINASTPSKPNKLKTKGSFSQPKSLFLPSSKPNILRRQSSIKNLFQFKLGTTRSFSEEFAITLEKLNANLHAFVDISIHSKSKSLFRPYKRCYLALNKNILYKFNHSDPGAVCSDEFALSFQSTISIPHYSKSGRWELEINNPSVTWILRFPSQAQLLQWLEALSIAQNRVSHNLHHLKLDKYINLSNREVDSLPA